jgi:hypothetical protein
VDSDIGSEIVNFYSHEKVISSRIHHERYLPYQEALETSEDVSFVGTHKPSVSPLLGMIGGKCDAYTLGPFFIDHNFREPSYEYRQIAVKKLKIKTSEKLEYAGKMLDRDLDTFWTNEAPMSGSMWIEFDLGKIYSLGMIRLWNRGFDHPSFAFDVSVEASSNGQEWHEVLPRNCSDFYYWSGPRIYYWEYGYRWELRFDPMNARYLRIKAYDISNRYEWKINEAYVYKIVREKALGAEGEKEILRAVSALHLEKIYADRWMSAKVREMSRGAIETIEPFTKHNPFYASHMKSRMIEWAPKVGFILENADADAFESQMKKEGIALTRKDFKRWVLFYFSNWGLKEKVLKGDPGWWWMGLGSVKFNHKRKSEYLGILGEKCKKEGKLEEALTYYRKATREYPNHIQARVQTVEILIKLGKEKEANQEKRILSKKIKPQHACLIQFEKGVEFLGYSISSEKVKVGKNIKLKYYWRLNEDPGQGIGVFVHVEGQGKLYQGDHKFLQRDMSVWPALKGEVFQQEETIKIGNDAKAGEYEIKLGLFDLRTGRRWKIRSTPLFLKDKRVEIGKLNVIH